MPATPAWPPRSLPRLFVDQPLSDGVRVELNAGQANYLGNVLRMGVGSELLLFDGASGEWLARVSEAAKKRMSLVVEEQSRPLETVPDVTLAFAPVKRTQTDWLIEKATELGVRRIQPVITQRTVIERVKLERLQSIAIEAAEQCGRTLLPQIAEPIPLASLIEQSGGTLYFADENGGDAAAAAFAPGEATILTGPEGGFTDDERAAIRAAPNTRAISLGPRILRAETAALAALATYMAIAGDWR
jgi:16S rRNA (uracil1498-N3)-methyltransferase